MRKKLGFSLIEIMVMLTIMGILSMVGLPAYEKYQQRARITEGVSILTRCKTELNLHWNTYGRLPIGSEMISIGLVDLNVGQEVTEDLPENIESIELMTRSATTSLVKLTYSELLFPETDANNRAIYLAAKTTGNRLDFNCGDLLDGLKTTAGFLDYSLLPSGCNDLNLASWLNQS